jgi:hypothetical protein
MTERDIEITRLAINLCGISCNTMAAETIMRIQQEMAILGDQFSLRDATNIQYEVDRKYNRGKLTTIPKRKRERSQMRSYIISSGARIR